MTSARECELLAQAEAIAQELNELETVVEGDRHHELHVRFRFLAERAGHKPFQVKSPSSACRLTREWREPVRMDFFD